MATLKLTPTQQKFYDLMADGNRHKVSEFLAVMEDPVATHQDVMGHISKLRKVLRPLCEDVACERVQNTKTYRRVRTLYAQGE